MRINSTVTSLVLLLAAVAVLAFTPADAAIAVKFYGEATAGELTPAAARAVARSGVDVTGFNCFEAPLVDLQSGLQIGTGIDCLNVFDAAGDGHGGGLQIEAKTFFLFPQGMIVNHGCTSVRPFFSGVGDSGVTHISGSIGPRELEGSPGPGGPQLCQETGGIIRATRGFRNFTGEVRLSGAVDLSAAAAGTITFSCVFVIDLEPRSGSNETADVTAEPDLGNSRPTPFGARYRAR